MLDFTLTAEQRNIRDLAHDFAQREIRPVFDNAPRVVMARVDHVTRCEVCRRRTQVSQAQPGVGKNMPARDANLA
jgi:hypothetical protein